MPDPPASDHAAGNPGIHGIVVGPLKTSRLRRLAIRSASVAALVLAPASPAWAHGSLGPSGSSNYRSALSGITPRVAGVTVQVLDNGQHVELLNTTSTPVVILGYSGEPYLMVEAGGSWQNLRSPSLYLNRSSTPGLVYMPPGTDAHAPPVWQRVCRCDVARWHDHRIHWGGPKPPASVSSAPGRYHLIETWNITARRGAEDFTISGRLSWVPGPSPGPWLGAAAVVALLIVPVGFARRWRVPLAAVLVGLVVVDAARVAGLVAGRSGSLGTQLHAVPYDGVFSLLLWLGSFLVGWLALRGRAGAPFGAATIGVILALTGGVPALSALWQSQVVTAYPEDAQRLLIAATLGIGFGLFAGGLILFSRLDRLEASQISIDRAAENPGEQNRPSDDGQLSVVRRDR